MTPARSAPILLPDALAALKGQGIEIRGSVTGEAAGILTPPALGFLAAWRESSKQHAGSAWNSA